MTNYVYIDTILQVFEADGNLHIIGAVASGETDPRGKDTFEKMLHLTIPINKALKIFPEITASLPKIFDDQATEQINSKKNLSECNDEFEGEGLHFKI